MKKIIFILILCPAIMKSAGMGLAPMDTGDDESQYAGAGPGPSQPAKPQIKQKAKPYPKRVGLPEGFKLELPKEVIARASAVRAKQINEQIKMLQYEIQLLDQQIAQEYKKLNQIDGNLTDEARSILYEIANSRYLFPDVYERELELSRLNDGLYSEAQEVLKNNNYPVTEANIQGVIQKWYSPEIMGKIKDIDIELLRVRKDDLDSAIKELSLEFGKLSL